MAIYYLDASAVVKYYVPEPGSFWIRQLLDAPDSVSTRALRVILVAEVTRVEVAAGQASDDGVCSCNPHFTHFAPQWCKAYGNRM